MSTLIAENLEQVSSRINAAEKAAGRISGIVQLIAVSKTRTANEVRKAVAAGAQHIGENYLQEALDKQSELGDEDIVWHFIGPIQSNKTQAIANHFDWVHSVDLETIRLALTAAETGHLVFGTLHTTSAAKTIDRIIDVFPGEEKSMVRSMLSESLQGVISQTLLKKKGGGRVAAVEILTVRIWPS